jgi:hypothetical protein
MTTYYLFELTIADYYCLPNYHYCFYVVRSSGCTEDAGRKRFGRVILKIFSSISM